MCVFLFCRTFSVGLGAPIVDSFSVVLMLVIAVCLGIPVLLIVVGGVVITCKRLCGRRRDGYSEISSSYAEIN